MYVCINVGKFRDILNVYKASFTDISPSPASFTHTSTSIFVSGTFDLFDGHFGGQNRCATNFPCQR